MRWRGQCREVMRGGVDSRESIKGGGEIEIEFVVQVVSFRARVVKREDNER